MKEKNIPNEMDVVIIGAGPAGSSAASLLRKANYSHCVIEKESFPRFIIGESLLAYSMDLLEEAGFLQVVHDINYLVKKGGVFHDNGKYCFFDFSEQFTKWWKYTYQVPRADFDKTLANKAEDLGSPFFYNHTVQKVDVSENTSVTIKTDDGKTCEIRCKFIIDASGYGRVLPTLLDLETPSYLPERVSIFSHVEDPNRPVEPEQEGSTWICTTPESWVWVIPFSDGITSVGIVGKPDYIDTLSGTNEEKIEQVMHMDSHLKERFTELKYKFKPEIIRGYSKSIKKFYGDNFCLVGNTTEFLDPVFSSGVTLALATSNIATKLVIKKLSGEEVNWEKEYVGPVLEGVNVFKTFIDAWYDGTFQDVAFFDNPNKSFKKQITSVLAGYVWDKKNPFVTKSQKALSALHNYVLKNRSDGI